MVNFFSSNSLAVAFIVTLVEGDTLNSHSLYRVNGTSFSSLVYVIRIVPFFSSPSLVLVILMLGGMVMVSRMVLVSPPAKLIMDGLVIMLNSSSPPSNDSSMVLVCVVSFWMVTLPFWMVCPATSVVGNSALSMLIPNSCSSSMVSFCPLSLFSVLTVKYWFPGLE